MIDTPSVYNAHKEGAHSAHFSAHIRRIQAWFGSKVKTHKKLYNYTVFYVVSRASYCKFVINHTQILKF